MEETKLWLDCFFGIFKVFLFLVAMYCAFAAGYETRRKEEKRVPRGVRRYARKRYPNRLHF